MWLQSVETKAWKTHSVEKQKRISNKAWKRTKRGKTKAWKTQSVESKSVESTKRGKQKRGKHKTWKTKAWNEHLLIKSVENREKACFSPFLAYKRCQEAEDRIGNVNERGRGEFYL